MQAVRQSPINLRPLLGIKPLPSTKGRGLHGGRLPGDVPADRRTRSICEKARACLDWLIEHKSPRFSEFSWANHFDFASRGGSYSKDESIIVWTALIGQAFIDGFEATGDREVPRRRPERVRVDSQPAEGADQLGHLPQLSRDVGRVPSTTPTCSAPLCWRGRGGTRGIPSTCDVAADAMRYSCARQRPDGSWWYAEEPKYHWIDNFHTGYNLDSLKCYIESTGDDTYRDAMTRGLELLQAPLLSRGRLPEVLPRPHAADRQPVRGPGHRDAGALLRRGPGVP